MIGDWIWLDGRIVSPSEFTLGPFDEGVLYGRGLFETTRTFSGRPWLWEAHVQRLVKSAAQLGISCSSSQLPSESDCQEFVEKLGGADVVLRLNVSHVANPPGVRVWMFARPLPETGATLRLHLSEERFPPRHPLAGMKSFNYLNRRLAYEAAIKQGFDDALLVSTDEQVLETAIGNVLALFGDTWHTPPEGGILPGTVRRVLLDSREELGIVEQPISLANLQNASAVVMTNSARGIAPVIAIGETSIPLGSAATKLMEFIQHFQER